MVLLHATALRKSFSGTPVVDGVDLRCDAGQVLGVLGPNGAGKTTTLKMLYGFLTPASGSIRYAGREFATHRHVIKRMIGVCPQNDALDDEFDVVGNLRQIARYFRPRVEDLEQRISSLLDSFALREHAAKRPDQLSGGLRRRLSIARALVHEPSILFLDEPTTGLDPDARVGVWELIARLRSQGLAIVLTTHYMDEAQRLCDELLVLKNGRTLAHGTPKELLGRLLGDQVLLVRPSSSLQRQLILDWFGAHGAQPHSTVLDELRLPLSTAKVAEFCLAFSSERVQVREPDLDDLFLMVARGRT